MRNRPVGHLKHAIPAPVTPHVSRIPGTAHRAGRTGKIRPSWGAVVHFDHHPPSPGWYDPSGTVAAVSSNATDVVRMRRRGIAGLVAVVTGGSRGIGKSIAERLSSMNARVAIGDIDGQLACEQAARMGALGLPLDVTDEDSVQAFLGETRMRLGAIDVLVNNAGVLIPGEFRTLSAAEDDLQVAVNLGGVSRCMRLVIPEMVERRSGHIINIASVAGRMPCPGAAVYSASKAAVLALSDAVRFELVGQGVGVTAVLPTFVRTEMAAGLTLGNMPTQDTELVSRAVARAITQRRPPARVAVPRWSGLLATLDTFAPRWSRDAARRAVRLEAQTSSRSKYQSIIDQQIASHQGQDGHA
ncbi:SDR family NAD(P)-dependent oxidoreductase [Micromonospora sediminimaris]|uniref:SDR family NAD(P)-dependent oxidoreductase n=1 Tax=Micromonospora sediminimaris TaxID=547162 RepID=UPI0037B58E4C